MLKICFMFSLSSWFGTIVHSMVDYTLALAVYKVLRKRQLKRKNYDKGWLSSSQTNKKKRQKLSNGQTLAEHFLKYASGHCTGHPYSRADGALSIHQSWLYLQRKWCQPPTFTNSLKWHELEEIGQELLAIVDNGGRVQNILIDHPVYGEIETLLKLTCRRDVQHFLEQVEFRL